MADRTTTPVAREAEPEVQPDEALRGGRPKTRPRGGFRILAPLAGDGGGHARPGLRHHPVHPPPKNQTGHDPGRRRRRRRTGRRLQGKRRRPRRPGKEKVLVPLPKILVNVAGSMMTRYLTMSMTLVGNTRGFQGPHRQEPGPAPGFGQRRS